jgi:uncharacterized membrane protein
MVDIHHVGTCNAPLEVTFGYLDDYRNAPSWMFGLQLFTPVGEQVSGVGAMFDGTFAVRPVKLMSTIRVTGWERDALIAYRSIAGFTNSSTWRFESAGDEEHPATKVLVDFTYELPGGLAGKALGRALEPIVAMSIRHSDAALRANIEQHYAQSGG